MVKSGYIVPFNWLESVFSVLSSLIHVSVVWCLLPIQIHKLKPKVLWFNEKYPKFFLKRNSIRILMKLPWKPSQQRTLDGLNFYLFCSPQILSVSWSILTASNLYLILQSFFIIKIHYRKPFTACNKFLIAWINEGVLRDQILCICTYL